MISQLKLKGMGNQIDLLFEVRLIKFPNIMIHEGDGNDQGKISLPVALNHF
jgi:hypothetical protein